LVGLAGGVFVGTDNDHPVAGLAKDFGDIVAYDPEEGVIEGEQADANQGFVGVSLVAFGLLVMA
jgi:hypothetical protein